MITRVISFSFCLVIFSASFGFCAQKEPSVRIAILQDAPSINVAVRGKFEIYNMSDNSILSAGNNFKKELLKGYPDKIKLSNIKVDAKAISIRLVNNGLIYINDTPYREQVNIFRKDNRKVCVINELGLESYIKGVLPYEVSAWWPTETLKAQAVVARTYALYRMQYTKAKDFDLTSDVYSQVYGGKIAERWRTNEAVDSTRGEVLTFEGKVFPAYYYATCGGHTEDAKELWQIDIIPLKGVVCGFCAGSPHFKWRAAFPLKEINKKLQDKNAPAANITAIEILGRDNSGRAAQLKLTYEDMSSSVISAKDFRQKMGPNLVRSTNFIMADIADIIYFEGYGWGHGVGLCQWGAYFMAGRHNDYHVILNFYYPGAKTQTQMGTDIVSSDINTDRHR